MAVKAVKLTQISGMEVQAVAEAPGWTQKHRSAIPQLPNLGVVALLLCFAATGCTLLGAALGAGHKTPHGDEMRPGSLREVPRLVGGEPLRLHLRDGRTISGRFDSLYWRVGPEYERLYAACQKTSTEGRILPDIGPVHLLLVDRRDAEPVEYVGLELTGIVFRNKRGAQKTALFGSVRFLGSGAQSVDVKALQRLASSGSVPWLTEIRLKDPREQVALNEVASIDYLPRKGNVLRGVGLGLLADLLFWVLVGAPDS